jgi:hypothetical protein
MLFYMRDNMLFTDLKCYLVLSVTFAVSAKLGNDSLSSTLASGGYTAASLFSEPFLVLILSYLAPTLSV